MVFLGGIRVLDSLGRVVVPSAIRQQLGLDKGKSKLLCTFEDNKRIVFEVVEEPKEKEEK